LEIKLNHATSAIRRIASHLKAPLSVTADGFVGFATLTGVQIAPVEDDGFVVARDAEILLASKDIDDCIDCAQERTEEPFYAVYLSDAEPTEANWADVVGRLLGATVDGVYLADEARWFIQSADSLLMLSLTPESVYGRPQVAVRCKFEDGTSYTHLLFKSRDLVACARFARSINSGRFVVIEAADDFYS
jgi:hypothetical protein